MKNIYTVAQVNTYIKNMFAQDFLLNKVYIKGEVSNCKYHSTGHIYFSLKDEMGSISCIMFASQRKELKFQLKDGQQVVVLGSVSIYERSGSYQLYAKEIILDGMGLLYEQYENLKKELEEMGMFAEEYKQAIPFYAKKIGIVTAPTGAAIQDIRTIAARRNPYVQLILYKALVQGEGAAESIVKGIEALDAYGVDVMIVGRGGGSIEDLRAFNEEIVARAIFECNTPIISAVGHETDTTIADYVADLRAPTPSAAAELAVVEFRELKEKIEGCRQRFYETFTYGIEEKRNVLERYELKLNQVRPSQLILEKRMRLSDLEYRFSMLSEQILEKKKNQMRIYVERFHGLSPLLKLQQGYSYTAKEDGKAVSSIEQVDPGEELEIYVADGKISTLVKGKEKIERV